MYTQSAISKIMLKLTASIKTFNFPIKITGAHAKEKAGSCCVVSHRCLLTQWRAPPGVELEASIHCWQQKTLNNPKSLTML